MTNSYSERHWEEGLVDKYEEHIWISYGDHDKFDQPRKPVARLTKQTDNVFIVEWLVNRDLPENQRMVDETIRELYFYLVKHDCPPFSPWEYAIYHCGTAANLYSDVHWAYLPTGWDRLDP